MTEDADLLLRAGDLDGARRALVEVVRSKPGDPQARMFLFQILALAGEWDKARTQLNTLAQLSPEAQMLSVAYGQALEAEHVRQRVFAGDERVALLVESAWAAPLVEAIESYAKGQRDAGDAARAEAFDAAPDTPGTLDGVAFDWIGDADGRFGPTLEAIVGGRYGLIPFDAIARVSGEGPKDLRDTVWYPVQIAFRSGQSVAALLPARYPGSDRADDADLRLGRATGWRDDISGQAGVGQHLLALSTDDEVGLLSIRSLSFD